MEFDDQVGVEDVTRSDILDLATWNQQRTKQQLLDFIERREAAVASFDDSLGEPA